MAAGGEEAEVHSAGHTRVREGVEGDRCLGIRQERAVKVGKTICNSV